MFILAPQLLFAMGLLSVAIVSGSPGFGALALGLFALGLFLTYRRGHSLSQRTETLLLILAIPFSFVHGAMRGDAGMAAIQYWLSAVLVVRAFRRLEKRDVALCFLIAAALYAHVGRTYDDLPFLFITLMNVILLPYALFHFLARYGGFEKHDVAPAPVALPFTRRQFRTMSAISLSLLLLTVVLFLLIPRPNTPSMLTGTPAQSETQNSGFSDSTPIGSFDRIREQRTIVMVVETDRPQYWRAAVMDFYEAGVWYETARVALRQRPQDAPLTPGAPEITRRFRVLSLSRVNSRLFSCGNIVDLRRIRTPRFLWINDLYSTLCVRKGELLENSAEYVVTSQDSEYIGTPALTARRWRSPLRSDLQIREDEVFLRLPGDCSDAVRQLAARITAGLGTPQEKADAVQRYLLDNYAYSRENLDAGGKAALDYFLFDSKRGHCEYFATAMAILLRTVGVNTRVVQGFAPGVSIDGRCMVRLSDAHLWTEILVPGRGWKSYDPTPGATERLGAMDTEGLMEQLRLRWFSHVVEYDGAVQMRLMVNVRDMAFLLLRQSGAAVLRAWTLAVAVAVLLGLGFLIRRGWFARFSLPSFRGLTGSRAGAARVRSFFALYLKELARRGYTRKPGTTPNDLLAALAQDRAPVLDDARFLTNLFYHIRFGGVPLTDDDDQAARTALRRIRRWEKGRL